MSKWTCGGVEFNEGDLVLICQREETDAEYGMGNAGVWHNNWLPEMDEFVGKQYVIADIDHHGVTFEGDENMYGYPLSCLENISAKRLQVRPGDVVLFNVFNSFQGGMQ